MFYKKQKRNQFTLTISVLVIALVILSITLVRLISTLLLGANNSQATTVEVATAFDYTRDRDQYQYPALVPSDYAREQYELSVKGLVVGWYDAQALTSTNVAVQPFDYIRDRDQYEYSAVPMSASFDYTRDRDQYEYPAVPSFNYLREREQYELS